MSDRRKGKSRYIIRALGLPLLFVLMLSCAAVPSGPEGAESSLKAVISKIDDNVKQQAGSIAWTDDRSSIAYISDSLKIYSIRRGDVRSTNIYTAAFIASGPGSLIYIISEENGSRRISSLDTETMEHRDIPAGLQPDAVFAVPDNKGLMLMSVRLIQKNLWAELDYSAYLLENASGKIRQIYGSQRIIQGRVSMSGHQSGWLWPGLRPHDSAILAVEYVKPPVIMPYLRITLTDYITGRSRDAGRIEHSGLSAPFSWSPDGNRLAFPDINGKLKIYDINEKVTADLPSAAAEGSFPSWNPAGSQIYFGGHIINSDGSGQRMLFEDARNSMGIWSPDGRMLAVVHNKGIYLLKDFVPLLIAPDIIPAPELIRKRMLLKELLTEKLITEQEYDERYDNLTKSGRQ